jgi:predicted dehydrogenase
VPVPNFARNALERGFHVVVEKHTTLTIDEALDLKEKICRQSACFV